MCCPRRWLLHGQNPGKGQSRHLETVVAKATCENLVEFHLSEGLGIRSSENFWYDLLLTIYYIYPYAQKISLR